MDIHAVGQTDVGRKREHNEDFFLSDADYGLWIVCDGMGGHACGEVASSLAARTIQEEIRRGHGEAVSQPNPGQALAALMLRAIEAASQRVYRHAESDLRMRGMGTTCTTLLIHGNTGVLGHVGDSRLYVLRGGVVYQISQDHTHQAEVVRLGLMTADEAKASLPSNMITRAVGLQPAVRVDTMVFEVLPGDTYLLCSDGLAQYVEDEAISVLTAALGATDVDSIARHLVDYANTQGGSDNVTALVVRAEPQHRDESDRATRIKTEFQLLSRLQLFNELEMGELIRIASHLCKKQYQPGETILNHGEHSNAMYVVSSGLAIVTRHGHELARLGPGSHFGEMALLSQRPRSAMVTAGAETEVMMLSRDRLEAFLREDPVAGAKVLWQLAQTLSVRLDAAQETRLADTQPYPSLPSPFRSSATLRG